MSTCDMSGFTEPINLSQWTVIWAWFCRADCFLTAGREQTAKSARLTQPEWIGIQIKWVWIWGARAEEGHLFIFKSSPYSREQAEAVHLSNPSTPAEWLSSDTMGPPQTVNIPDCSNFALTAWGFHLDSQLVTTDLEWIFCRNLEAWVTDPHAHKPSNPSRTMFYWLLFRM